MGKKQQITCEKKNIQPAFEQGDNAVVRMFFFDPTDQPADGDQDTAEQNGNNGDGFGKKPQFNQRVE
ncbi:MAG: hypothetical protein ACI3XR_03805 [Eubacteriales bacterium]